jgi:hypothetical protein
LFKEDDVDKHLFIDAFFNSIAVSYIYRVEILYCSHAPTNKNLMIVRHLEIKRYTL